MKKINFNNPDMLHALQQKVVRIVQHNRLAVTGRLLEVRIDEVGKKPDCLTIEQYFFKKTRVGNLKREGGLAIATVYLKNIDSIDQI